MADQHYIPQFYLRTFRDPDVPEGREPWLWVADLAEKTLQRRAPKNVGKKADYYAFPEVEAAGGEAIEALLSQVESAAAPAIGRLLVSPTATLKEQDRADVLYFMAFMVIRVPSSRNAAEKIAADVAKLALQMSASHPGFFENTLREALEGKEDLTPEHVEEVRQWLLDDSKYTIRASPKLSIATGFEVANDTIFPVFDRMTWAVLRARGDLRFITSDTPVCWVDPTLKPPACFGIMGRNVEATFPLSPTVCLLGTWDRSTGVFIAKDAAVEKINARIVGFADRHVFADNEAAARRALEVRARMEEQK